uniref:Ig-like domain-containing protein n=1 Tax=Sinocyclocheilus rhinocerous TaxID=307959 RepID=A0A673HIC1_9TELE
MSVILCYNVDQSPPDVIKRRGESAEIRCSHSVPSYNQINWYRQNQEGFTLMGYLFATSNTSEKEFMDKIVMSGNGNSDGLFTIKNLASSDSAVYFCAACYTMF